MTAYLDTLKQGVDADAIRKAAAWWWTRCTARAASTRRAAARPGRGGVRDQQRRGPTFDGLHPEPIPPWVDRCIAKVPELGFDAGFINDGDADRIGAVDEHGNFVNPHRIITLLVSHLAEDKGQHGRVVSTITASAMLARQCKRLGLELTSTPVGFKWIYAEMEKGDVMLGGEESGGIGIPSHVMERDGLLMALLLAETMAQRGMSLGQLVDDMFEKVGKLEFERRGLKITEEQMANFPRQRRPATRPTRCAARRSWTSTARDGVKFYLEGDAWVMDAPLGTGAARARVRRGRDGGRSARPAGRCRTRGDRVAHRETRVERSGSTRSRQGSASCSSRWPRRRIDANLFLAFAEPRQFLQQGPGGLLALRIVQHAFERGERHGVAAEQAAGFIDGDILPVRAAERPGRLGVGRDNDQRVKPFHQQEQRLVVERSIVSACTGRNVGTGSRSVRIPAPPPSFQGPSRLVAERPRRNDAHHAGGRAFQIGREQLRVSSSVASYMLPFAEFFTVLAVAGVPRITIMIARTTETATRMGGRRKTTQEAALCAPTE